MKEANLRNCTAPARTTFELNRTLKARRRAFRGIPKIGTLSSQGPKSRKPVKLNTANGH